LDILKKLKKIWRLEIVSLSLLKINNMRTIALLLIALTVNLANSQDVLRFKTGNINIYTGYDGIPETVNTYSGYIKTYWEIDKTKKVVRRYWDKNFSEQMGDEIDNSKGIVYVHNFGEHTYIDIKTYTMKSIGKYEIKSFAVKKRL
jgi:hypothetical protein